MSKSKAHVRPSEWAAASKAERELVKGHGGYKPTEVKPVTRAEHRHMMVLGPIAPEAQLTVNPASTARVFSLVLGELKRTEMRQLPADPLRRCALVAEEAGEVLSEALDLTRPYTGPVQVGGTAARHRMRTELVQCASMAITVLAAMAREDEDTSAHGITIPKTGLRYDNKTHSSLTTAASRKAAKKR